MGWFMVVFFIEAGMVNGGTAVLNGNFYPVAMYQEPEMSTYAELGLEMSLWDVVFVGGSIENYQVPVSITSWIPHRAIYHIYGGVRYKMFEVGIRHYCDHPVVSGDMNLSRYIGGGQTKIYAKFTAKVGGK